MTAASGRHTRWSDLRAVELEVCAHRIDEMLEKEAGKAVHLILDNYCTHKSASVMRWLVKRPHWHLHFTPTHASWLNQVERFFAKITAEAIRRGNFHSVPALEAAIEEYLEVHNRDPKPFKWTADADRILEKTESLCKSLA